MGSIPLGLSGALQNRYRLERELGRGGMATVYLAEDVRHRRRVALKVLRPELAAIVGTERFLAEIELTANLQHSHLLPLFDSGEANGLLYYVMPFVDGETLRLRLSRERQLSVEEAVRAPPSALQGIPTPMDRHAAPVLPAGSNPSQNFRDSSASLLLASERAFPH